MARRDGFIPLAVQTRKYELEQLSTYGYCSMQYHLRYNLGLPWAPVTAETGFALILREAFREFFRCLMTRTLKTGAVEHGLRVLLSGIEIFQRAYPRAMVVGRRGEYMLAVSELLKDVFIQRRDTPIGYDIPATVHVELDEIAVNGVLDFAFWQMAGQATETAVVLTVVGKDDPLEDYVNFESLKVGFAMTALRESHGHDVLVQHHELPVFKKGTPRKVTTLKQRLVSFEKLVRAIDRGIRNQVFIPQSSPEKCFHCPYKTVCSASLVDSKKLESKTIVVNPFAGWPKRK